jgi:hypothetical protein
MNHKIITHSGKSHLDDFLSVCLVLALDKKITLIERKDPHPNEIYDENTWVLDIGEELLPEYHVFDHHQKDWEECTLSLLLKELKLWDRAKKVYRWLEFMVLIDAKGIMPAIQRYHIDIQQASLFSSFINDALLMFFSEIEELNSSNYLFTVMRSIGEKFFSHIEIYERVEKCANNGHVEYIYDVPIYIVHDIPLESVTPMMVKRAKNQRVGREGIVIYPTNRPKNGYCMIRCDDDSRVNFNRITKDDNVVFIHSSGFMCTVKSIDNYKSYITQAIE